MSVCLSAMAERFRWVLPSLLFYPEAEHLTKEDEVMRKGREGNQVYSPVGHRAPGSEDQVVKEGTGEDEVIESARRALLSCFRH